MRSPQDFVGEFIGTFLLVFFRCGSIVVEVLYSAIVGTAFFGATRHRKLQFTTDVTTRSALAWQ